MNAIGALDGIFYFGPPDLSAPLQLPFLALALLIAGLKVGALVLVFRRRAERVGTVARFVAMAVVGVACRAGSFVFAIVQSATRARNGVEAFATWSLASSLANAVSVWLDSFMLVGMFVAAAVATIRDRVPEEKPPTYRHAPAD